MSTPRFWRIEVWIASSRLRRIARGSVRSLSVSAVTGSVWRFASDSVAVVVCICWGAGVCCPSAKGARERHPIVINRRKAVMKVPPRQGSTTYSGGESFVESRRDDSPRDCSVGTTSGRGDWLAREVASSELSRLVLDQRRHLRGTNRELRDRTAGVEDAAARRVERRRD